MPHRIPEKRSPTPTLLVLARGTAKVQDHRALMEGGTNRFLGWKWDGTLGPEFTDPKSGKKMRHGGRVKQVDQPVAIAPDDPYRAEYVRAVREGDLWAADEATARFAGVAFEPHFGGEHPATSALAGLSGEKLLRAVRDAGFDPDAGPAAVPWDADFKPQVPADPPAKPAAKAAAPAPAGK